MKNVKLSKTFYKNWYKFILLFFKKKGFTSDLVELRQQWNSPSLKSPLGYIWHYKDEQEINKCNLIAFKQRAEFVKSLPEKKAKVLRREIVNFLEKYDMGAEWFSTIVDHVISMWLFPPPYNLYIKETGRGMKKRVILVINPDTSFENVKEAWGIIEKKQKQLWPSYTRTYLTKRSFKNLDIAYQDALERFGKKKQEFNTEKAESSSHKTTDLDIVAKIWPDEMASLKTDQRRSVNLRQIRKRFKNAVRNQNRKK